MAQLQRTQVLLPKVLKDRITFLAEQKKISVNQQVRELLQKGLETQKPRNGGVALMDLAKLGLKGPKDLSRNIDKYLYEDEK